MQLLLLTLLLSASSLALPTDNAPTESGLEKRAHYGWIGSYAANDHYCVDGYLNNFRPEVESGCIAWKSSGPDENIGINWGTWPLGFQGLQGYSDTECKHPVGGVIEALNENNTNAIPINTCVKARDHGGPWGSISQPGDGYNGD